MTCNLNGDYACALILCGGMCLSMLIGLVVDSWFERRKRRIDAETAAVSEARKALDARIDERAAKFQREVR